MTFGATWFLTEHDQPRRFLMVSRYWREPAFAGVCVGENISDKPAIACLVSHTVALAPCMPAY